MTSFQFENTFTTSKIWKACAVSIVTVLIPILVIAGTYFANYDIESAKTILIMMSLIGTFKLMFLLSRYYKYRNIHFKISLNEPQFLFGTINNEKVYSKNDITSIKIYAPENKKPIDVKYAMYTIIFNNENTIELSTILIPVHIFVRVFPESKLTWIDTAFPFM